MATPVPLATSDTVSMATSAMATTDLTFYPSDLWGLDYLFQLYNKMYISDILQMKQYPMFPGAFAYKNHPIYKVDVLGVVVAVAERPKFVNYAIDDGTGVITVSCWKQNFSDQTDFTQMENIPNELKVKVGQLKKASEEKARVYDLGDLVHMKGKVQIYRERKEIFTSYHKKVDNPCFEVLRMVELLALYKNHYDKPFILPHKVSKEIQLHEDEKKSGVLSEMSLVRELRLDVHKWLTQSTSSCFSVSMMQVDEGLRGKITELQSKGGNSDAGSLLRLVLNQLENDGLICETVGDSKPTLYEVIFKPCNLDKSIIEIMKRDISKPKCAEKGCHWLHVLEELRKTKLYSKVNKSAILRCLDRLESESDIISTTNNHYMAL